MGVDFIVVSPEEREYLEVPGHLVGFPLQDNGVPFPKGHDVDFVQCFPHPMIRVAHDLWSNAKRLRITETTMDSAQIDVADLANRSGVNGSPEEILEASSWPWKGARTWLLEHLHDPFLSVVSFEGDHQDFYMDCRRNFVGYTLYIREQRPTKGYLPL